MKKGRIALAATVAALALVSTGCGKTSKVVCTQDLAGMGTQSVTMTFKDKKINSASMNMEMDLSSYSDQEIELIKGLDYCSEVSEGTDDFSKSIKNCKTEVKNKKYILTANIDIDTLAKNENDKVGTADDAKKTFEAQGYKCTIK